MKPIYLKVMRSKDGQRLSLVMPDGARLPGQMSLTLSTAIGESPSATVTFAICEIIDFIEAPLRP